MNGLKKIYGIEIEYQWNDYTPRAKVSIEAESIAKEAIRCVVGDANTAPPVVTSGSNDFHFYTIKHPNVKATMIGIGAGLVPGLHHPDMTLSKSALDVGARILAETLKRA